VSRSCRSQPVATAGARSQAQGLGSEPRQSRAQRGCIGCREGAKQYLFPPGPLEAIGVSDDAQHLRLGAASQEEGRAINLYHRAWVDLQSGHSL